MSHPTGLDHPHIQKGLRQSKERGASYFIWTNGDCWQFFSLALKNAPICQVILSESGEAGADSIAEILGIIEKIRFVANPQIFDDAIRAKWKERALPAAWDAVLEEHPNDLIKLIHRGLAIELGINDQQILDCVGGGLVLETHRIDDNFDQKIDHKDTDQLKPGITLLNRYLIQGIVGVGGMGAVYSARDMHFPNVVKRVAVKEMINLARDPSIRETIVKNFEREANILATLNHPSIPRIYDYFSQDERSYLILEYIDGKDMEALLLESQDFFQESQVFSWAIELCDVLNYLHHHKPEPVVTPSSFGRRPASLSSSA